MKTLIVNESENTRVPFLRGILTRSLLDCGLTFAEAFEIATEVRERISGRSELTSEELREEVAQLLKEGGHREALAVYREAGAAPARIVVSRRGGGEAAFSRARHELSLRASGMKAGKAERTTAMIYDQLLTAGLTSIDTCALGYLTYQCLLQERSRKAARRYLVWSEFQLSARPLFVLICGAVGTGKSTIATEAAHILDIVRIQSTDMLREVMRMMLPRRLLPVLHTSSYDAWTTLPIQDTGEREPDQLVAEGYRSQTDLLAVACEAVLSRAAEENVPLILEGVHAHPELAARVSGESAAVVVHVTLAVLKTKQLKARLRGRGSEVPQRRAERYLESFDSIWALQSYLLSEADRCNVPIITNDDRDRAVLQVIQQVIYELSQAFAGEPGDVYAEAVARLPDAPEDLSWRELVPMLAR